MIHAESCAGRATAALSTLVAEQEQGASSPSAWVSATANGGLKQDFGTTIQFAVYPILLGLSVCLWFVAFRAPLWQDETGSYWQICKGFSSIWERQSLTFPAYSYILWLWAKVFGISAIALRIPSVLAMLAAAWLTYRAAREICDRELSLIATILFCLNPIVVFEAIDVRPYAFAVLTTSAALLALLRLRRTDSKKAAALFGVLAALVVWFHYIFAVILPGFLIAYWLLKRFDRKASWQQFGVAAASFAAVFLAVIPGLRYLFRTSTSHVFEPPPTLQALFWTLVPGLAGAAFAGAVLLALLMVLLRYRPDAPGRFQARHFAVCASVALIPIFLLYVLSAATPIHCFVARHRLVAVPGLALCWACLLSLIPYRTVRFGFCLALVGLTAYVYVTMPELREHGYSWKAAIEVAGKNASADGARVLMCSDFPEADTAPLPYGDVRENSYFTPLSYYKISVPVYGLPRSLNEDAKQRIAAFVRTSSQHRQRFLAMAFVPSFPTLDWISQIASGQYEVRTLGTYDDVKVMEFDPRSPVRRVRGVTARER